MNTDFSDIYELNLRRIAAVLKSGEKRSGDVKAGIEVEHFITDVGSGVSACYSGGSGVREIISALLPLYEMPVYKDGVLIGAQRPGASLSIEPAAQLEVSIEPKSTVNETEDEYRRFAREVNAVLSPRGLRLTALGYHPVSGINELELIPKKRYRYMYDYFTEKYAHNMMKGTASTQVSLDYTDEADFGRKIAVLSFLGLLFSFFGDNTPIFEGKACGRMMRSRIWNNTDRDRCGNVPGALSGELTYRKYAAYLLNVPPIVMPAGEDLRFTGSMPLKNIFARRPMSADEAVYAMSMIFPNVRAKTYLEVRQADSMPLEYILSYIAVLKGIAYSRANLCKYAAVFAGGDELYRETERNLAEKGREALVCGRRIYDFGLELCADAAAGGALNTTETVYLSAFKELFIKQIRICDQRRTEN